MNIEIDDKLMLEAMAVSGHATYHETVAAALRFFARRKRQADMRVLFGAVDWHGDLPTACLNGSAPESAEPSTAAS